MLDTMCSASVEVYAAHCPSRASPSRRNGVIGEKLYMIKPRAART